MTDPVPTRQKRFPFGELIGLGALVISGLGLWNSWRNSEQDKPTEVVERKLAVPLVLRGQVRDEGRGIDIAPVEQSHALDSLELLFPSGEKLELGSDGRLEAAAVEDALGDTVERKGNGRVVATVSARYVEAGSERQSQRKYAIAYRWEGGGLLSGKKLRLTGFTRA